MNGKDGFMPNCGRHVISEIIIENTLVKQGLLKTWELSRCTPF